MNDRQSRRRFASLFLCTIALLAAMASAPFGAWGATPDQSHVPTAPALKSLNSDYYGGQTFTVGVDGTLDSFEVELNRTSGATTDIDWRIETTSSGLPTGTVLANGTITNASVGGGFVAVDVSAAAIPVAVGEMYAIILQGRDAFPTPATAWSVDLGTDANYPGGAALDMNPVGWKATANDYGFRTYVPEPGQEALELSALFVLSLLALFTLPVRRNRRNQRS